MTRERIKQGHLYALLELLPKVKDCNWKLDKNFIYGGWRLVLKNEQTGTEKNYTYHRLTNREMYYVLRALTIERIGVFCLCPDITEEI